MSKIHELPDRYNAFTGSIPENYERPFVPLIFADYPKRLADSLNTGTKLDVLEIACGTGIVTRNILETLPQGSRFVATDINEPMLEVAKKNS